jgi:tRNA dimethylallyltransferase
LAGSEPPVVSVICGPTAAGKSYAALRLAELAPLAVVSADSRQLYRGFDVGTAKPTRAERERVPHYGIDVLEPVERSSAAWWADRADGWIRRALADGRVPVVVGGTGLYLRALFGELFVEPPMDAERRAALQAELEPLGVGELRRRVALLDPTRAALGRTQLLRAIEVATLTGRRVSELHRESVTAPRWRARYLVVDPAPGAALASLVETRARAMFAAGWRDEVRGLVQRIPPDAAAWNSTGYRTVRLVEQGVLSEEEALQRVVVETRQYAKRQRTWFRHQLTGEDVTRIDLQDSGADERLVAWWRSGDVERRT